LKAAHSSIRHTRSGRRESRQRGNPCDDWLSERHGNAGRKITRRRADSTTSGAAAQDCAECHIESVECAGNAHAWSPRDERTETPLRQMRVNHGRLRVQVEQGSQPRQERHELRD
jgi:hypothetical protein